MAADQVRWCPWCLQESALDAHETCAARFSEALISTGKRDPALMMSVMAFIAEHRHTDPAWGRRALRMLRGEEPVPPIDNGG